ncbi:MAG: c-type cytochrome [Burkholderiales bacterium]
MAVPIGKALRAAALAMFVAAPFGAVLAQGDVERGAYLAKAGGCLACHTAEAKGSTEFAGGNALKTPFGTFYGPNITPDPKAGIGHWSEADFIRAMRHGTRPDGAHYYPAFPYPSYTKIADSDLKDLFAYLRSLPPSAQPSKPHELHLPFRFRFVLWFWKFLFFTPGPLLADAKQTPVINRGAYLVQALGHCGECHTPRNLLGGPKGSRFLAGGKGPDGKGIPNITPTKLKKWSDKDLTDFLTTGLTPDGDVVAASMGEVITNTLSKLTPADLAAMLAYLRSIPALPDES